MIHTLNSSQFRYDSGACELSADISDFGKGFTWGQVYPDAADAGLRIMSVVTGHVATFAVVKEERDEDGDVLKWELKAIRQPGPRNPILDMMKVVVYND
jgi:hypothetical protein